MVEMVNKMTGSIMYVQDNRVDEYLAAGHKLAAEIKKEPVKKTRKKKVE